MKKGNMRDSHVEAALNLLFENSTGALATIESSGFPYVSHVEYTATPEGKIYFLLSDLAVHTRNVQKDNRVALVVVNSEAEWLLSTERATFQGNLILLDNKPEDICHMILEKHPSAEKYIQFSDFHIFSLELNNIRYIKGFGEMSRFTWPPKNSL